MILPSCFVIPCIEYAERGWAQAQREPEWRRRLLICHLKTLLQEGGDLFFFTGLRLEANKQTECQHFKSPFCHFKSPFCHFKFPFCQKLTGRSIGFVGYFCYWQECHIWYHYCHESKCPGSGWCF